MNATPTAIALAKELGVELEAVEGSGREGRIIVADVKSAEADAPGVVAAVKRELKQFSLKGRRSALAASALELAKQLDSSGNSATSKSMCSRSLIETMDRLRELEPEKKEKDRVDAIRERRAAKRSGKPKA